MSEANQYTESTERNEVNRSEAGRRPPKGKSPKATQTAEGCPQGKRSAVNPDGRDSGANEGVILDGEVSRGEGLRLSEFSNHSSDTHKGIQKLRILVLLLASD